MCGAEDPWARDSGALVSLRFLEAHRGFQGRHGSMGIVNIECRARGIRVLAHIGKIFYTLWYEIRGLPSPYLRPEERRVQRRSAGGKESR